MRQKFAEIERETARASSGVQRATPLPTTAGQPVEDSAIGTTLVRSAGMSKF